MSQLKSKPPYKKYFLTFYKLYTDGPCYSQDYVPRECRKYQNHKYQVQWEPKNGGLVPVFIENEKGKSRKNREKQILVTKSQPRNSQNGEYQTCK